MASNREERRLQRLRGAQTHQVADLDFGIQFPNAAAPRPALPQLPSNRRTPAARGRGRPSSTSSVRTRNTPPPPLSTRSNNANISAKRRKLDEPGEVQVPSSSNRSTRSQGKRNVYDIDEEGDSDLQEQRTPEQTLEAVDELAGGEESVVQTPLARSGRGKATPLRVDEEVTESPRDAPGSGQRRQLGRNQAQALSSVLQQAVADVTPIVPKRSQVRKASESQRQAHPESVRRRSPRNARGSSAAEDLDELSPEQPEKRLQPEVFSDVEGEEQEEAETIDEVQPTKRHRNKRKRKTPVDVPEEAEEPVEEPAQSENETDEESAERPAQAAKRKRGRPKSSPATQRQPKSSRTTGAAPGKSRSRNGIPIAVQRLTKPIIFGEDNTDVDILNVDIPYAKRGGVNAVDVLAQVSEEVLISIQSTLEDGGSRAQDSKTRREYRTKLRAVEAFQEELRITLFELTTMVDAEYALTKRVREAQKEKIQNRQELLRIRAEREQIALRMDEVRIKHESRSKAAQEQLALNTSIQDIELAVSLAIDNDPGDGELELAPPDLGVALKTIAEEVSSKSGRGGILKQIREFNDFLERAALALEGRS